MSNFFSTSNNIGSLLKPSLANHILVLAEVAMKAEYTHIVKSHRSKLLLFFGITRLFAAKNTTKDARNLVGNFLSPRF
jgi:hypothetical protein